MFPASNLPAWLTALNRIDPLTYAVDPMRRIIFSHLHLAAAVARRASTPASPGTAGACRRCSRSALIAVMGLVMLGIAIAEFSHSD